MKQIVFTIYFLLILRVSSHAQWYVKKYNVTDIDFLSREQLTGERGMKDLLMVTGAGIVVGGAIAVIIYLGRIGKIKSVINEYYSCTGPLKLSPAIIVNYDNQTFCPGITLTFNF